MTLDRLTDLLGDRNALAAGGLVIGLIFGVAAQHSRFCLYAATRELTRAQAGGRVAIWLIGFGSALFATQALVALELVDAGAAPQLNNRGSLSGALLGGLVFGVGMALTRACASRMLAQGASGDAPAMVSTLAFAVAAWMTRDGWFSPLRGALDGLWTMEAYERDLIGRLHIRRSGAILFGLAWLLLGGALAARAHAPWSARLAGAAVGLMAAAAWSFNSAMSLASFEVAPVHGLSFASPSADLLNFARAPQEGGANFDLALIPGVLIGASLAAVAGGEWRLRRFRDGGGVGRALGGGVLMGFGGVLAGGCSMGSGVSGAAVFASTSWLALASMGLGAALASWLDGGGVAGRGA